VKPLRIVVAAIAACGIGVAPLTAAPILRNTSEKAADGFTIAAAPYTFAFPRDHAAHDGYQSEWWYYTGHLRTAQGRTFGYELTFFRIGLRPGDPKLAKGESRWRGNQLFPAHFALTDERDRKFEHFEKFSREALGAGSASTTHLDVKVDDWTLDGAGTTAFAGTPVMHMHAHAENGDTIDLAQTTEKKPAIHGHDGISKKAACRSCASHYYSLTELRTGGKLRYEGATYDVTGLSWMDHEYGSDELQTNQAGWDWFAIQLDDDREFMLYRLRQKDGTPTPQSSGSIIDRNGNVTYLPLSAFSTDATGSWKSPHTGGTYPSGWHVRVPQANVDIMLDPTVKDQELSNTIGGVSYWEGSVVATDANGKHLGVGYVELTGYAGAISL
jgi:predicted secreted hydrolase